MIAPNTDIYLLKVPIEIDEMNQLTFSDIHSQYNYFMSCEKLYLDNATYQRKDNVIRYPSGDNYETNYDQLLKFNYCCYRNDSYSDKVFYAFIKNMRYVNDGMTEIEIETDVFQTWQFDIEYKSSFIEREHVSDDGFGINTVPEGLETGEYVESGTSSYAPLLDTCPVLVSTKNLVSGTDNPNAFGTFIGNKYEACDYYIFKKADNLGYNYSGQSECIRAALKYLEGSQDAVVTIFMAPKTLAKWSNDNDDYQYLNQGLFSDVKFANAGYMVPHTEPVSMADFTTTRLTSIGTHTVRNKKLLTFPYCYMLLTNNNGGNAIYHYEDFAYTNPSYPTRITFNVKGTLCPSGSVRAFPVDYKNIPGANYTSGLSAGKFPICSWINDIYTNWLTQNGVNFALSATGNIGMFAIGAGNAAVGNPIMGLGMMAGGVAGVVNDLKEIHQKSYTPPQAEGDIGSGEICYSSGNNTFVIHHFRIKEEYANIIDSFFDTYGYKVNRVKTPNIHSRRYWNYIKTIDMNLTGDIPQTDIMKLKEMFNHGCTFWHDPAHFLDYSQSNTIIS